MKKLMVLLVGVLFTAGVMAQDTKTVPAPAPAKSAQATTVQAKPAPMAQMCYMMMDGKLMRCMGEKKVAQTTDVTLANGTKVTTKGQIITKDGKTTELANGMCVDLKGMTSKCDMGIDMKHDMKPADKKTDKK